MTKVDIVGGSLSGLSAAISLKEVDHNIDVVVHEKYKEIGYNHEGRRCGEAYSLEGEWKRWKPIGKSIFNKISTSETIVGEKKYILHRKPGTSYVLNRQEFINQLGKEAEKLDVKIQTDDKIKSIEYLDGDYIIDASGCPSSIKRELGFDRGMKGYTYQQTIEDCNYFVSSTVKIISTEDCSGYYWIFPRDPEKKEVNIGVGVIADASHNLKEMLEWFKEKQGISGKINYVTGGLIPAGIQKPLKYKNILFVGDAGVGTFPLSGQGIYRALLSGETAGKCIAMNHPEKYPKYMYQYFIKWDVIGKNALRVTKILNKVGEKAVLYFYHNFLDYWYMLQH